MKIRFLQEAGIGDILFLQTAANKLIEEGHEIYWPVINQYEYLAYYIPQIKWEKYIDRNNESYDIQVDKHYMFHNLRPSDFMRAKYELLGMDSKVWIENLKYKRFLDREQLLMERLNLTRHNESPYRLIQNTYATECSHVRTDIERSSEIRNIYFEKIDDFNIFDWCSVIENASEIHAVNSCSFYLIETLNLKKNPPLHFYSRQDDPDSINTYPLCTKDWVLHPGGTFKVN